MATIRKRGSRWQVQIRRAGQRSISQSFHRKKDAELWARQMEAKADWGELAADPRLLESCTLGDLVERYRDTVVVHKRCHEYERILLNAFLRHPICAKPLSDLSASDFAAYRDERLKEIKPSSLKRQLSPLHHMFEVARDEWGLSIKESPLDRVRLNGSSQRRERRLKQGEFKRLIEAARFCRNLFVIPIIQIAVETGMRRGEIVSILWEQVDLKNRSLFIPYSKNGEARTIPLTKSAVSVFQGLPRLEDRVFPITANALRLNWQRLRRRAALSDLHFHDLRHEAISRFFEIGLSAPEVALISGHRDIRMLFRYSHPLRRLVVEKLDNGWP